MIAPKVIIRSLGSCTVAFLLMLPCISVRGQEGASYRIVLNDAYLMGGFLAHAIQAPSYTEWRGLFPESDLLKDAPPKFTGGSFDMGIGGMGVANVGFIIGGTQQRTTSLRLGLVDHGREVKNGHWSDTRSGPYDTLISTVTGGSYPVDTVFQERYQAHHTRNRIGLDVALVMERNTRSRWSFQWGAGIMGGMGVNGRGEVSLHHSRSIENSLHQIQYGDSIAYDRTLKRESFKTANTHWYALYLLFGVDLRLAQEHAFWSRMSLHYEARPGWLVQGRPNMPASRSVRGMSLFGIRFRLR